MKITFRTDWRHDSRIIRATLNGAPVLESGSVHHYEAPTGNGQPGYLVVYRPGCRTYHRGPRWHAASFELYVVTSDTVVSNASETVRLVTVDAKHATRFDTRPRPVTVS